MRDMAFEYEEKALELPHKLTLDGRNRLNLTGVTEVERFDENTVVLRTTRGELVIRGSALHLQLLSLDGGQVRVDGTVDSMTYEDDEPEAVEHLTCAYDIAVMSRELLKHDDIRRYTTIWMDTVRGGEFGLSNTNKLVRFFQGTTGLKTGYTSQAGHCLAASAMRDGVEYIAVVLKCASSSERFQSAKQLLSHGFANYTLASPDPKTEIPPVSIVLGTEQTITPMVSDASPVLVERRIQNAVRTQVEVTQQVKAPVEKGQQLGTVTLVADGETLAQLPLVAPQAVARRTWWDVAKELLGYICFCA